MIEPTGYTALDLIGFTDKGTYSASASYVRNDLVHYGGNIWRCLIDDTTGIVPAEGANFTMFIGVPESLVEASIAPIEQSPATTTHANGSWLFYNDVLYEVISAIAVGDNLVAYEDDPTNANIKLSPRVEEQIGNLKSDISNLQTATAKLEVYKVTMTNISTLPKTYPDSGTDANIEDDMVVINSVLSNPAAQTSDWTWVTSPGTLTISGTVSGTTDIDLYLMKSR